MIPVSNGHTSPCSPISSNCVIWQGPDIPCIGICNGDTVSDVVGKLGEELCTLIDECCGSNPDIQGLDLKCLPQTTTLELEPVLQAIIDYICSLNPGEPESLPNVQLPQCLWYDDTIGNPVTQLPLLDFVTLLGNKICLILSDINSIQLSIVDLQSRVTVLENCVLPCIAPREDGGDFSVLSSCLFAGSLVPISQLVLALESEFCQFRNAVGSVSLINTAISAQCVFGSTPRLSGPGTYSSVLGWVNSPTNLAQSNVDQWLVICDLYAAVKDIQDNCCDTGCDGVIFGVSYTTIDSNGDGVVEALNLNFTSSTIPAGFNDCGGATVITITDSNGSSVTQSVNVTALSTDPTGVNVSVSSLNTLSSLVLSVPFCVTDGTSECADKQTTIIPLNIPCPASITATPVLTDINVLFSNALGASVTYTIVAIDTTTGSTLGSTTITSPGVTVTHTFGGAIPGRTYNIIVTVSQGASVRTCPPISVLVPGTTCTSTYITSTGTTPGVDDIYLGAERPGGNTSLNYYYNPISQQIVVGTLDPVVCDSPQAVTYSISVSGVITIDLQYGATTGTAITTNYSLDGLTWSPDNTGVIGIRNIATGATSGTVYLRARTECSGSASEYLILRYDFATDYWTVMADPGIGSCLSTAIAGACPVGVEVATQTLACDGSNYNVFGGGVNSKWYYVGKYVRSGNTVYVYAGWKESYVSGTAVSSIVECCVCPAFILTDTIQVFCQEGAAVTFTVPYVLGEGSPNMTITGSPVNGTLTQATSVSNEFTYTNTVSGQYGDTFTVTLVPSVAGVCEQATATIQIQIIPCDITLQYLNQPIYAFINTGDFSVTEGNDIKVGLQNQISTWNTLFGYTGDLYFIPVADNKYLGYAKSIVDDGASATLDTDPAWVALQDLPPSWSAALQYKDAAFMFAFTSRAASDYHGTTLASGFTGQPTASYQDDYDALYDMLNGTQSSAWAQSLGITTPQFPDGFSAILYPFTTKGSTTAEAAMILQSLAAYTGEMIPPAEYGIETVVDVTGYLMQNLVPSASNPYDGFITAGGNIISGLYTNNWLVYLNNILKSDTFDDISANQDAQFIEQTSLAIQSCTGGFPTVDATYEGFRMLICETGLIENVEWLGGVDPAINEFWSFSDPSAGTICGKALSSKLIFANVTYSTGVSTPSLIAGCESCGSTWLVEDCESGEQYRIDASTWSTVNLEPGMVFAVTNDGNTFIPGDGRATWSNAEVRCVILQNLDVAAAELSSTSEVFHSDCATCGAS